MVFIVYTNEDITFLEVLLRLHNIFLSFKNYDMEPKLFQVYLEYFAL